MPHSEQPVRAAVIGSGMFGGSLITQSRYAAQLQVMAVAEIDTAAAMRRLISAGVPPEQIEQCETAAEARRAMEAGRRVVAADAAVVLDLPVDIVVECTGVPDAAAAHARQAIDRGLHVAMVSKEADVTVGPILKHLADRAGVVYTAVDGDQHGLAMRLFNWAGRVGLEVLCAGKALDVELMFDPQARTLRERDRIRQLTEAQADYFTPGAGRDTLLRADRRRWTLVKDAAARNWDLVELTIIANGTGLHVDWPTTHCRPLYISEIPQVLRDQSRGGLLSRPSVDSVCCLRFPHEAGLGGGAFIVVRIRDDDLRAFLNRKGLVHAPDGETAVITHPRHMLGVEAIDSLISAVRHRQPTGAVDYRPRYDVVAVARRDLRAGEIIGNDHSPDIDLRIVPAVPLEPNQHIALHLASGRRLATDAPRGAVLRMEMVEEPAESLLWALRRQQDEHFKVAPAPSGAGAAAPLQQRRRN